MRTETDQSRKKKLTHTNFNLNKKHLHKFAMLWEKRDVKENNVEVAQLRAE